MDYEVDTFSEKFNWAKKTNSTKWNSLNGIECFLEELNYLDREIEIRFFI